MGIRSSEQVNSVGRMVRWPSDVEIGSGGGGGGIPYENVNCVEITAVNSVINTYNPVRYNFERTDPFSLSLWIKSTQTALAWVLGNYASAHGWCINIDTPSNIPKFTLSNTWGSNQIRVLSTEPIRTGAWVHFVCTYDGSSDAAGVTLYKNKADVTSAVGVINNLRSTTSSSGDFLIGNYYGNDESLVGKMAQLTLWDKELSSAEVTELWALSDPRELAFADNMIGFFPLGNMGDDYPVCRNHILGYPSGQMINMSSANIIAGDAP